ncbi:hypothetical protein NESM_000598100 [Novymonas esmeraldas]|uniref:Uncharacterized protein n=1 Tax=Novymonas esmeraldas TaxID=1808958 RepID=A0AAW0ESW7_9TRYP
MTSSSASPALPAGCEEQRTYTFSLHCKRSLNPTLTHQFRVVWPWPAHPRRSGRSTVAGVPEPASVGAVKVEEDCDGEEVVEAEATEQRDSVGDDAAVGSEVRPLWRERRRYGQPTFIIALSSDPVLGRCETRRVALLLSPGHRSLLPLVPLLAPEPLPDGAGLAYWRTSFKPPGGPPPPPPSLSSAAAATTTSPHAPPCCAELLVGELQQLERVVWQRREAATAPAQHSTDAAVAPLLHSEVDLGSPPPAAEAPARLPSSARRRDGGGGGATAAAAAVRHFFFYTIPFRVRWLSQLPGRLVASLPCEERLVTLHAPHDDDDDADDPGDDSRRRSSSGSGSGSTTTSMAAMTLVHSFALPRGVVPLEVSEVFDRPFLAVGTAEHGVLLCDLDSSTGAVHAIARCVAVRGYGSAIYPVTRLAAVFPPAARSPATPSASSAPPPWLARAEALESLRGGALVCSSPYEPTAAVVKLGAAADGTVEDFAAARSVDTILDVSAEVQASLGPLVCTTSRKLLRLRVIDTLEEEVERRAGVGRAFAESGLADRVRPCLTYDRMAQFDVPLLHVASSPVVRQTFAINYVSRRVYTKHWQVAVDSANRLILLDRSVSQYLLHSTFSLRPRGTDGGGAPAPPAGSLLPLSLVTRAAEADGGGGDDVADAACASSEASSQPPRQSQASARLKRPRTKLSKASPAVKTATVKEEEEERGDAEGRGGSGAVVDTIANSAALPTAVVVEDACVGLAVTCVRDEVMQVAAAHDRDCISLVTWRIGPADPQA